jgi:hypothetical protein
MWLTALSAYSCRADISSHYITQTANKCLKKTPMNYTRKTPSNYTQKYFTILPKNNEPHGNSAPP